MTDSKHLFTAHLQNEPMGDLNMSTAYSDDSCGEIDEGIKDKQDFIQKLKPKMEGKRASLLLGISQKKVARLGKRENVVERITIKPFGF